MDRSIVYPGSIPLDSDLLSTNRNTLVAIGALVQATLGTASIADGLALSPTAPASLSITVGPGSITSLSTVDQNAYGSLPADTADPLMKMGVNLAATTIALAAPTTTGQSVSYLIQAAFQESDANPVVLPYYNAANPSQPYLGPNNTGVAQSTQRTQRVQLQVKASAPAITGTQITPPVDSGWSGLAVVVVAYGQTQITATNILPIPTAPLIPFKLPNLRPGFSQITAFSATSGFVVPAGVNRAKITVVGAGGGGAGCTPSGANFISGAGGGSGGTVIITLQGLTPGVVIPVTVGAGGAGGGSANTPGAVGGTSSFGTFASATGGNGGGWGTSQTSAGGAGGQGVGGQLNLAGGYGGDGMNAGYVLAGNGGASSLGGGGRAGAASGFSGLAPGSGGGGNYGAPGAGGAGGPGIVIVEY